MKLSKIIALIAWLSVFAETWLLILGIIPNDLSRMLMWGFFLLVALGASAISQERNR